MDPQDQHQTAYSDATLRFEAVIQTATDAIILIDESGVMELVNQSAAQMFGYAIQEMIGRNVSMLMHSPHREKHDGYIQNYVQTGIRKIIGIGREVEALRKDGHSFPCRLSISEVHLHNRRIFTGILHDLTEQKQTEKALQEEKERAQRYLDVANTLIVVIDRNHKITLVNSKGSEILGYAEEELLGKDWFDLCIDAAVRDKLRFVFDRMLSGERMNLDYFENPVITKDGQHRLVAFRNSLLTDEQGQPVAALSSGIDISEQRAAEERIRQMNAELELRVEQRTEELAAAVNQLLNINQKLEFEIQERKSIEEALRQSEAELRDLYEREKELNVLKSRFVAMASHEFRTPLSTILSSADLIEAYLDKDQREKRMRHTARIKSAVSNLTSILNDFLSLSKLEEGKVLCQPVQCDLRAFCHEIADDIQGLLKPGQELNFSPAPEGAVVYVDKKLLKNVLFNLLSNAIKYSPAGKSVHCQMDLQDHEMTLMVRDEGIGIPEEEQQHLFTRFFRAHNVENIQGTGLGLNIVKRYLELMQGNITFESKLGEGTTFFVQIPLKEAEAPAS